MDPGWQPSQTALDAYECRHGLGYTIYKGIKNELEACVTALVPIGADCELNKISLKNLSDSKKTSVFILMLNSVCGMPLKI